MEAKELNPQYDLSFEKKDHKPGVVLYVFKDVAIAIDTTGKNYKELPEILFGTFDNEYNVDSFNQPKSIRKGVDMKYISACIKEVSKDSGINEFWFHPYREDKPEPMLNTEKEKREQARLRLFKRYFSLTPDSEGFGYIVKL